MRRNHIAVCELRDGDVVRLADAWWIVTGRPQKVANENAYRVLVRDRDRDPGVMVKIPAERALRLRYARSE